MEKYKDLILSLIRENKKYTPECEEIIDEIVSDVYAHAEGILSTVTNESVIKSYLEKAVTTSVITVSRRMGIKSGRRADAEAETAKIEEILHQAPPAPERIETVVEPKNEPEISETAENIEEIDTELAEPEENIQEDEDSELLEEIAESDEVTEIDEQQEVEDELEEEAELGEEPEEEFTEESEFIEEPEEDEAILESDGNELDNGELEEEFADLQEENAEIEEEFKSESLDEEEFLNIDENVEEPEISEPEPDDDVEKLIIDESEEEEESEPVQEVDKTLVDRMINGVPSLEEIEDNGIDELLETSPENNMLESFGETDGFDIDAEALPEVELPEYDLTDTAEEEEEPEESEEVDESAGDDARDSLTEYSTDSLIDDGIVSDDSDLLESGADFDVDELVNFGGEDDLGIHSFDDTLVDDLSGDLGLDEVVPENKEEPENPEESEETVADSLEPPSFECFSFEPEEKDTDYQDALEEIGELQAKYADKPITEVFNLKYKENLPVNDIASKLEISEDEVLDILDNLIHIVEE